MSLLDGRAAGSFSYIYKAREGDRLEQPATVTTGSLKVRNPGTATSPPVPSEEEGSALLVVGIILGLALVVVISFRRML